MYRASFLLITVVLVFITAGTLAASADGLSKPDAVTKYSGKPANSAMTHQRVDSMRSMFSGRTACNMGDLKAYTGPTAVKAIVGSDRQETYQVNHSQLRANYNSSVEFQLRDRITLLCPQTADYLYHKFTPTKTDYRKGSRPQLEMVVGQCTQGLTDDKEKMLALMRFCRDLYKKQPEGGIREAHYIYGGTEEQLIEKGEELCEGLGRLFVALCEVDGIPARVVHHVVGGHIVAEAYVNGGWAYVDPRTGLYFVKSDGRLASTWDLWQHPEIMRNQPDSVKADVGDRWTWDERIWKCEHQFFDPKEINGFVNYRLSDSIRYDYSQTPQSLATKLGLWTYHKRYVELTRKIFGLEGDGWRVDWSRQKLRNCSVIYRNDGFSQFYSHTPPMSAAQMDEKFIDPMAKGNMDILEWGLGPGSVFCYDTKVGQVFGEPLTDKQRAMLREGDRNVWRNVTGMISAGADPLREAVNRGHELGIRVYARLEMNHEYGPASEDNWKWVGLVGDFNKKNPQYRIPGSVNLDFKHREVRKFKLAILREAAERGCDGISMDFAVYPPFFEKTDPEIMTGFMREVRKMTEEVGSIQNRRIDVMVRFPAYTASQDGLDWKRWMREKLVDAVVPASYAVFDVDMGEFISMRNRTGVKVLGTLFASLSFVDTDATPKSEKSGRVYDKPKTPEMYNAQAMLLHRAGVDGIQLGMSANEWNSAFNNLADPSKLLYSNKRYMANQSSIMLDDTTKSEQVEIRIADDPAQAMADGQSPKVKLIVYCSRLLGNGEALEVTINGKQKVRITPESLSFDKSIPVEFNHSDPNWWRSGEHTADFDAGCLKLGRNIFDIKRVTASEADLGPMKLRWVDLEVSY